MISFPRTRLMSVLLLLFSCGGGDSGNRTKAVAYFLLGERQAIPFRTMSLEEWRKKNMFWLKGFKICCSPLMGRGMLWQPAMQRLLSKRGVARGVLPLFCRCLAISLCPRSDHKHSTPGFLHHHPRHQQQPEPAASIQG